MTDGVDVSFRPSHPARSDFGARLVWGMLALSVFCVIMIAILPGLFFADTGYFHDLFVTLDIVYRTSLGLHSSLDYFGPIGPFVEWAYHAILLFAPANVHVINLGNALMAALSLGLSWITLRRRADPTVAALVALMSVSVVISGIDPDRPLPLYQISHLAPYNYWGWALLCPVALRAMLPTGERDDWPGAVACALALAAMFLLKVNYAVGGAGLIFAGMILRTVSIREGASILGGMALTIAAADLVSHGQVRAYLGDLRTVSQMPESGVRIGRLIGGVLTGFLPMCAFCWALLLGLTRSGDGNGPSLLPRHRQAILAVAALGAAAVAVSMQDHDNQGVALLPLMPAAVIEWARAANPSQNCWRRIWAHRPEWLVAALLVILPLPTEMLVGTLREIGALASQKSDPRFDGTPYAGLVTVFPLVRQPAEFNVAEEQYWKMLDGWQLLTANGIGRDARIVALSFSNPFPALMRAQALRNIPSWLHDGRVFSRERHLPPEVFFDHVTCVMQARNDENTTALMQIYGPYLKTHFQPRAVSDEWILWTRI